MKFASRHQDYLPEYFYNIKADLSELPKPPLNPSTGRQLQPEDLKPVFSQGFIQQEITLDRYVKIPEEVREAYSVFRPTPLVEASHLKKYLDTPARIFYKYEGAGPVGSHKTNTALMQAYLAQKDGISVLSTETGAGQWGSALAYAGALFDIQTEIFMVRSSYHQKPGRKILMELFGGKVFESPSNYTESGRKFFKTDPGHPGSLGIAISEAVEKAVKGTTTKYALGSVLDCVLMHQTVIGLEAEKQMAELGLMPDVVIGCVGGGSNFAGLAFPFVRKQLVQNEILEFIAVEPDACPTLTCGQFRYDHGDTAGLTPLLYMHTLGCDFVPPPFHAGGLRYHGMAPLVSHLVSLGIVKPVSVSQKKVQEAAVTFLRTEGILPAPESSHAIAAVIDRALEARAEKKKPVILFNLSGHGFLDISAFSNHEPAGHQP